MAEIIKVSNGHAGRQEVKKGKERERFVENGEPASKRVRERGREREREGETHKHTHTHTCGNERLG